MTRVAAQQELLFLKCSYDGTSLQLRIDFTKKVAQERGASAQWQVMSATDQAFELKLEVHLEGDGHIIYYYAIDRNSGKIKSETMGL